MMAMCSKKAYMKPRQQSDNLRNEVDTNVVQIKFDVLKENVVKIHQGDAVICQGCQIVLNKYSMVQEIAEQFQKQMIWVCEFCDHKNNLQIEKEEIPLTEDVVYLIQSAHEVQAQNQDIKLDQTVVFCIDNSGSMSSTSEVKGKINFKHGLSQEEYDMLKQFIEPGDENQFMPGWNKNITHVSRKQCVLAAIENQIEDIKKTHPNKMVGLVTFNNEVVLFGDGSQQPLTIAGDRLFKADEIRQQTQGVAQQILSKPVKDCAQQLIQKFEKLQEKGQTALGPALLASLELAKLGKPGSMVIICTDGLANLGLGSLEGNQAQEFYEELGDFAAQNGIAISVVTIKGEGCRMDILSKLSEKTNGTVTRVQPDQIGNDFANILKDEIVGTHVDLKVRLHRALMFRNEEDPNLTTTLNRQIGNVTVATVQTFEYQTKLEEELKKLGIDLKLIKKIPFQIQITYQNLAGDKLMRVVSQQFDTTMDLQEAEKEAKVEIIHKRMQQQTAKFAKGKKYDDAQSYNNNWHQYVQSNEVMNMDEDNRHVNKTEMVKNMKLQTVVEKQSIRQTVQSNMQSQQQKEPGFIDKLTGFFKPPPQAPQAPQAQQAQQQPPQPQINKIGVQQQQIPKSLATKAKGPPPNVKKAQQQQLQVKSLIKEQAMEVEDEEEDEDNEIADLLKFEQQK